jgi:hypothetical protein
VLAIPIAGGAFHPCLDCNQVRMLSVSSLIVVPERGIANRMEARFDASASLAELTSPSDALVAENECHPTVVG